MKHNIIKYGLVIVLAMIASMGLLWADCNVDVVQDTIVIVKKQYIGTTDTIVLHDTITIPNIPESKPDRSGLLFDFLLPLLISVLGAFVALCLIYCILRPKIHIDPILTTALNGRAWFIVRNESKWAKLHSIRAELSYFKYDSTKKDYKFEKIELGDDDNLSMMYTHKNNIDSFYTFHTKYAFIVKDIIANNNNDNSGYDGVRIRVSATHAISGVFDTIDKYLYFENAEEFPSGEYINGKFHSIDTLYDAAKLPIAKQIVDINRTLSILYMKFNDKDSFEKYSDEWKNAISLLKDLKSEEYSKLFLGLTVIHPTISEMLDNIEWLEKLYKKSVVYTPLVCDKRDKYIIRIMRDNIQIALYMKTCLTL